MTWKQLTEKITESGISQLSTLMIETPEDIHCCGYGLCTCTLIKNPMMMMELSRKNHGIELLIFCGNPD